MIMTSDNSLLVRTSSIVSGMLLASNVMDEYPMMEKTIFAVSDFNCKTKEPFLSVNVLFFVPDSVIATSGRGRFVPDS